jgi:hypothetical protein
MNVTLTKEQTDFIFKTLDEIEKLSNLPLTVGTKVIDIKSTIEPTYCPTCNSCGEEGCCPPDRCDSLYNLLNFTYLEKYLLEKERLYFGANGEINRPNLCSHIIEELRVRFKTSKAGLYCDHNIKTYYEMQKKYDELYNACKILINNLEKREESDSGTEFSPNYISSCRVLDGIEISNAIKVIKNILSD